jgi:protease I
MDSDLAGKKVAILVHNYFEQVELTSPKEALENAGATVHIVSPESQLKGLNHLDPGDGFQRDVSLADAKAADYDAIVVPGGVVNADNLRVIREAQDFLIEFDEGNKPIAIICHGPWLLVSARLARGRKLTSYHTLKDDIINAGGDWVDEPVVVDRGLITSRKPDDLDAFNTALLEKLGAADATLPTS